MCSLQTFKTFLLYTEHEIRRSSLNERVIAIIPRLQLCIQHSQTILQSLLVTPCSIRNVGLYVPIVLQLLRTNAKHKDQGDMVKIKYLNRTRMLGEKILRSI